MKIVRACPVKYSDLSEYFAFLSRQSEDWAIYTFQDFESCD